MLAAAQVASATSVVALAFLWAPKNFGVGAVVVIFFVGSLI